MADMLTTLDSPEAAHALVHEVVRSPDRVIACACSDVQAFMRDAIGFPHEGVPTAEEWPKLTQRVGEFLTAPGRVLLHGARGDAPVDEVVEELLSAAPATEFTDVLVATSGIAPLSELGRDRVLALATEHGVRIYIGG